MHLCSHLRRTGPVGHQTGDSGVFPGLFGRRCCRLGIGQLGLASHVQVPDKDGEDRHGRGAHAHQLSRSDAEEGPVVAVAEELEQTPLHPVPHEVQQADVPGDQDAFPRREVVPQPQQDEDAEEAEERFVEGAVWLAASPEPGHR